MSILSNTARIGNFTSSEIHRLLAKRKGVPEEYISEKNMERKLGVSLDNESNARPLVWGKLLESRCFDLLGMEYTLTSDITIVHPTINWWAGSPDGTKPETVADIKCPQTRKSFCQLVECETIEEVREAHKDGDKYYWQIVSNAILTGSAFGELIVYMPYLSELPEIRIMAQQVPSEQLKNHYWIAMGEDNELPYLPDECAYKNLNTIRFEIPQADKDLLTDAVLSAGRSLYKPTQTISIEPENLLLNLKKIAL